MNEKLKKIGKGALIAGGGAAIVYALQIVATMDFGEYTPLVVAFSGIIINAVYQIQKDNQ